MSVSKYYYTAQLSGWSLYILISTVVFMLTGTKLSFDVLGGIYLVFALGLIISHLYRWIIIELGWLEKDISSLIPRVALACILLAIGFHGVYIFIGNMAFGWKLAYTRSDANLVTWGMLFFIWSLIYFTYNFFQRFRKEEIKNLQLESAKNEYELRRLRDQMNPHFIFNAMNTIRALIDEDPSKAKRAVTQLSNVLRSSLQAGESDLIPLAKEIEIVKDYLEIEKARYEERLYVEWQIQPTTERVKIPPLLLQTIVENSIKHGIAQLPDGGKIFIESVADENAVDINIFNTGAYNPEATSDSSLGLENTRNRLNLSFGAKAWLTIGNHAENTVKTTIHLPFNSFQNDTSDSY
ncbi:histidine kinase [Salibacteraceae bacterium]|nr:histidine kinase [Salibacteraceae bacterium]MDB4105759.1 histidine kinase [Salibacteraceae bacterium]MDB9710240.1 histidine kinase [Salibacteraceae bacterium]